MSLLKHLKDRIQGKAPSGKKRSSQWSKTRKAFLAKNPHCAVCGGTKALEVHHIVPFHENPELELCEANLIVLCESRKRGVVCHLFFGHLGNYRNANRAVNEDAAEWKAKIEKSKAAPEYPNGASTKK